LEALISVDAQRAPLAQLPQLAGGSATTYAGCGGRNSGHRCPRWRQRQLAERRSMAVEDLLDDLAEIVDDVKPISNLNCLWCTTRCPFGISSAPITGHNLNAGMCFEPVGERGGRPILE
jgi:hypothetical protein